MEGTYNFPASFATRPKIGRIRRKSLGLTRVLSQVLFCFAVTPPHTMQLPSSSIHPYPQPFAPVKKVPPFCLQNCLTVLGVLLPIGTVSAMALSAIMLTIPARRIIPV